MAGEIAWGDVRLVELEAPDKMRPALVLTRTSAIPYLNAVTIAPITSTIRGIPTEVRLGPDAGLKADSAANVDCLQTVRKQRIGRYLGRLGNERRAEVLEAVCFAFELGGR